MLLAPAGIVRNHFGFDETYDGVAKHLEVVVHPGNDIGIHAAFLARSRAKSATPSMHVCEAGEREIDHEGRLGLDHGVHAVLRLKS